MDHLSRGYQEVGAAEAYSLQNAGGLILLCTKGAGSGGGEARYDLAPIAWCCPLDYDPVSKFIVVCDTAHRSYEDLKSAGEFVIALPDARQKDLVLSTGSISGNKVDKYAHFSIPAFRAETVDAMVPEAVVGWLECSLGPIYIDGTSAIITGLLRRAFAKPGSWGSRLHYIDEATWFSPGPAL